MRNVLTLLSQYAEYHRDQRNIATHFVGVPMIVFAVGVLLARPEFQVLGRSLTPAWLLFGLSCAWYLTRHAVLGLAVCLSIGGLMLLAHQAASGSTGVWLSTGLGFFVLGWMIQFLGHYYEGRKPAFIDDLAGLLVGPMFVVAEALFALGWNPGMLREIEKRAGPTVLRDLANARP
ncbi:DUF962 domain-containing protein [Aquabacterium sp. A7-Y]|uniref:Mpo1 family 2-hydroxy fatty acid dioxygenase n=1 Tax=Aquabacterium sp. A7-Y TaxID=1349605 RepID=UPI00223DBF67|nr:Mpo1-like protein [Aquabacterium sp. A7-Y]MCW7538686.1 DUF962 domain-containing protein [Aquabacterium sp. A7-Y]